MRAALALSSWPHRFYCWTSSTLAFLMLSSILLAIPGIAEINIPSQASAPRSGLLVPLYIYPGPSAWDPLYIAIETHPTVDFIIVVNPASGPGPGPLPDENFTREITRLNQYPNVRTIGYVAVDYGKKPPEKALADMDVYARWSTLNPDLGMQGIFLDESPQLADASNTTFMEQVRAKVKSAPELSAGLLVMNPGMIPDGPIFAAADKTVVFEERYQTYINLQTAKQLAALPERSSLVCLMHTIPEDMSPAALKAMVSELTALSGSIFLTDLSDSYYHQFSPRFQEIVDAMT